MTTGIDRFKNNAPDHSLQAWNAHQMGNYDVFENVSQQNLLNCSQVSLTDKHKKGIRQKQPDIDRIIQGNLQPFRSFTI